MAAPARPPSQRSEHRTWRVPGRDRAAATRGATEPCVHADPRRGPASTATRTAARSPADGCREPGRPPPRAPRPRSPPLRRAARPPAAFARCPSRRSQPRQLLALFEVPLVVDGVLQPLLGDLLVEGAALEQLLVRAAVDQPAAIHDHDLVRERDRRE